MERVPESFPVRASKFHPEAVSEESITGVVHDISGNGLSFFCEADYAVGDFLNLQIDLPGSSHQVKAKVVRKEILGNSKIIAAVFVEMSLEHQKTLVEALLLRK